MIGITKQQQTKKPKQRTCKICKEKFTADPNLFCPPTCEKSECRYEYAMKHLSKKATAVKKENNKALKEFNGSDKNVLKRKAIQVFNEYIRKRDTALKCVSCPHVGDTRQWHAGHYRPAGNVAILRFDERNVHKQCSICNNHLSGNLVNYRKELIIRIGLDQVEELEATNDTKQYTIEEYAEIIKTYKQKIKELKCD